MNKQDNGKRMKEKINHKKQKGMKMKEKRKILLQSKRRKRNE